MPNELEKRIKVLENVLFSLSKSDRYIFEKDIQLLDGRKISTGTTNGLQIGKTTTEKLGFYGTTPVDQPATVSDANVQTASYVQADVQSIADAVNNLIDRLQETGLIA